MNELYFIGIDLGTSSLKAAIFDASGNVIDSSSSEYEVYYPAVGWAEQDPEDWYNATVTVLKDLVEKCKNLHHVSLDCIAGIGLSGQMHGGVFLDNDFKVLRPAILWCDNRPTEECKQINQIVGKEAMSLITGNYALPNFTAGKILWVRNNEPYIWHKISAVTLPKDYLRYRMTGVLASEISDASGTNMLDIKEGKWSTDILQKLDISEDILPPICGSADIVGRITNEFSCVTGLPSGIPVVGGAADNAAAAIGMGCISNGMSMVTVGTSGVILSQCDKAISAASKGISLFRSAVPNSYLALCTTLSAAHSLKWFVSNLCKEEKDLARSKGISVYNIIDGYAEQTPIGSNGLLFLPHLNGGRSPLLDEGAKGAFIGLTATHGKPEMSRAVMEGVAFSMRRYLDFMREAGILPKEIYACGGGMQSRAWREIFADNFGIALINSDSTYASTRGAAILAAVGAGAYQSVEEACKAMNDQSVDYTYPQNTVSYDRIYEEYKMIYPALKPVFERAE